MAKVKAHRRRVGTFKTVPVRRHKRKLDPRRAGRNYLRAYRNTKRKRHSAAAWWFGIATAEGLGYLAFRGAGVVAVTAGVLLVVGGRALSSATADSKSDGANS